MNIHYQVVLKIASIVMMVIGIAMVPSFLVSLIYGDDPHISFEIMLTILLVLSMGSLLYMLFGQGHAELKLRDGFLLVALCWIISSAVGAVPYIMTGILTNPFDAFFESVSGFSTTGASVIPDVESLPRGIVFWRAFTQWIGGVGILVFAIGLMPSLGISGQNVMSPDTPSLSIGRISTKMSDVVKTLYTTYAILSVAEFAMLKLAGMSVFDAMVHTFSCVGTGGFSSYNDGVAHFGSPAIYAVLMVFMLICGVNFTLIHQALRHGFGRFLRDLEFRFYGITILVVGCAIYLALAALTEETTLESVLEAWFQTVSILSTTGYTMTDYTLWPYFCQMLLLCLMFIGGCSSSTSGGVKAIRILVVIKYITYGIHNRLHPNSVEPITINGTPLPTNTVSSVTYHIFLYIIMMFCGSFLISLENMSLEDSFSSVITCMGNIGPAFGDLGPGATYENFSWFSKLTLSAEMLAGRLELYTLFILFTPRFWQPDH